MSSVSLLQRVSSIGQTVKSDNLQNLQNLVERIHGNHEHDHDQSSADNGMASSDNRSLTIESMKSIKDSVNLNKNDLWSLCPILLYQLAAPTSLERSGCVNGDLLRDNNHHDIHAQQDDRTLGKNSIQYIFAKLNFTNLSSSRRRANMHTAVGT